ncbi:prickle planar cell polarity protein 3-like isoform X2 [Dreissena polymorpha]|uniref:prickle planar cell polarity protein 3-like isoform X2 n=1 Tax=Dreissena polymorpha TaxID=45954 RepID=UPI00226470DB|nr:prickle planar cell polarity protein 3-like isoform X2 [Dreissena polymorpha]
MFFLKRKMADLQLEPSTYDVERLMYGLGLVNYLECVVNEVDVGQPCLACEDKCTGFKSHEWRSTCTVCRCPRELHDIYNDNFVNVRDRLGWRRDDDPQTHSTKEQTLRHGYSWVPAGLTRDEIEEYMEQLPNHKVPKLNSPGEKYRDIQLIYQLPKQDLSSEYCKSLETSMEMKEFKVFRELRDSIAMDMGVVKPAQNNTSCSNCSGEIEGGELVVVATKLSADVCYHPACFVCCTCEELLVDLTYCQHSRRLYCERHYAELIRPRCPACDEVRGA